MIVRDANCDARAAVLHTLTVLRSRKVKQRPGAQGARASRQRLTSSQGPSLRKGTRESRDGEDVDDDDVPRLA